ncbi:MAG: putative toxin-antitoxin system toxin component, PIN family [Rhodospirillales bacterium]
MRLVLDTDVVVAAMRSPTGASAALLMAATARRTTLVMSVPLVVEYESVCRLAEHRLAAGLNERQVDVFLDGLAAIAEPVEAHFLWRPRLRDPGDEMVLEAAVNGRANAIVTFNTRDFGTAPLEFGVAVWKPSQALKRIKR